MWTPKDWKIFWEKPHSFHMIHILIFLWQLVLCGEQETAHLLLYHTWQKEICIRWSKRKIWLVIDGHVLLDYNAGSPVFYRYDNTVYITSGVVQLQTPMLQCSREWRINAIWKKHISLSVGLCDQKHANRIPRPKSGFSVRSSLGKYQGYRKETWLLCWDNSYSR